MSFNKLIHFKNLKVLAITCLTLILGAVLITGPFFSKATDQASASTYYDGLPAEIPSKYYSNKVIYSNTCLRKDLDESKNASFYNIFRASILDNEVDISKHQVCDPGRFSPDAAKKIDLREGGRYLISYSCLKINISTRAGEFSYYKFNFLSTSYEYNTKPNNFSCIIGQPIEFNVFDLSQNRYFHLSSCPASTEAQILTRILVDNNPAQIDLCNDGYRYAIEPSVTVDLKDSINQPSRLQELNQLKRENFNLSKKTIKLTPCAAYGPRTSSYTARPVINTVTRISIWEGYNQGPFCEPNREPIANSLYGPDIRENSLAMGRYLIARVCGLSNERKMVLKLTIDAQEIADKSCGQWPDNSSIENSIYDLNNSRYLHFANCQSRTDFNDIIPRLTLDNNPNQINLCDSGRQLLENFMPVWDIKG